jgi:hypothetical protein
MHESHETGAPAFGAVGVRPPGAGALALSHVLMRDAVGPGDTVVDATAGNGHDTAFLARLVAPGGAVHAFDIQPCAIDFTRQRLIDAGIESAVSLYIETHENAARILADAGVRSIRAAMFNLGYLPGSDKACVTTPASTCRALAGLVPMLNPDGVITIVLYRGHPGGNVETDGVIDWAVRIPSNECAVGHFRPLNQGPARPELLVIRRQPVTAAWKRNDQSADRSAR